MKKRFLFFFLFLFTSASLSAEHYLERAKRAHAKLDEFLIEEAFVEYTEIIESGEEMDLNDLYWLHRHRALMAFLLHEEELAREDLAKMEEILITLGYPLESMIEFRDLINEVLKGFSYLKGDHIHVELCGGFWHCVKRGGEYIKSGFDKACDQAKEAWYRATNNEERLTQLMIEKRAKELYYPNLVHSKDEMERRGEELVQLWGSLKEETKAYLRENENKFGMIGGNSLATVGAAQAIKSAGGFWACVGTILATAYTARDLPDWSPIKEDLKIVLSKGEEFMKRDRENREASYTKCLERGVAPPVEYLSSKDSIWCDKYYFIDVEKKGATLFIPVFIF